MSAAEEMEHFATTGCDSSMHPEDCLDTGKSVPVEVVENESYEFGRLWPDGTFSGFGGYHNEKTARKQMDEKSWELKEVPEALRPVLGRQRSTKRIEIFKAEPVAAEESR